MFTSGGWADMLGGSAGLRFYLISLATMIGLAVVDLLGPMVARAWAERHHQAWFVAELMVFGVVFTVYANSLQFGAAPAVMFGWVVILQIGLLTVHRVRLGVAFPPGKWVAIAAILALQAYLILVPYGVQFG